MYGKILVNRLRLIAVMPMMKLWRYQEVSQWPKLKSHVGMNEGRLNGHHDCVEYHGHVRKPNREQWNIRQAAREQDIYQMQS